MSERKASRELDAEVAEKVMGWRKVPRYNYWMTFPRDTFELHELIRTWSPSTKKAHAEQVRQHLEKKGISISDTAPLAICLAALAATEASL